ncbi:MAG: hypothetical protein ACR2JU_11830, partial [Nocardioidaceae bacterium]
LLAALGTLVVAAGSIGMLVAFSPGSTADLVRPVVLLGTAAGLGALAGCGSLLPDAARAPYLALVVALLCGPPCLHVLMLVAAQASGTLPGPVTAALTAAGLGGSWVGWRWAERAAPWGLLLMAAGAAAGLPADLGAGRRAHRSCAPRPGRACCEAFQRWPMVGA